MKGVACTFWPTSKFFALAAKLSQFTSDSPLKSLGAGIGNIFGENFDYYSVLYNHAD